MVARINSSSSVNRALNYNEQKVKDQLATLLHSEGFLKDTQLLNYHDKLSRFKHQMELNDRAKTNTLHISLNFDPSDKTTPEMLIEIARHYMARIDFADQPYLVYQHHDAGHPHMHIVTTNIRADGSRIDTYNIGRNQSEKARKEIEQLYSLKRAEKSKLVQGDYMTSAHAARVQYGKAESKKAIQNVLAKVVNTYRYTSLAELNAVLKQYNVTADPGGENSRIYNNRGLVYRILDEQGNKVGVPIKASLFFSKPTLKYLEGKFASNHEAREPYKARVKNAVDLAFLRHSNLSLTGFTSALKKEGISTNIRQNKDGLIYGLTYVDHNTKCVFNGSDLGKAYSAKGVMERVSKQAEHGAEKTSLAEEKNVLVLPKLATAAPEQAFLNKEVQGVLETLIKPDETFAHVPGQLSGKGRKRKKKNKSKGL